MAYSVHQGEKIARPSWPAALLENAKFFYARLARASAPEREGAEGSIDASDRARAGDAVESQPAKIQARTVRRYCEKIK